MKVIDLLNKIANGEEVQQFEYYGGTYRKSKKDNKYWCNGMWFDFNIDDLNDEVEIIEEDKKLEKISLYYRVPNDIKDEVIFDTLCEFIENQRKQEDKINEIIDYLMENKDV